MINDFTSASYYNVFLIRHINIKYICAYQIVVHNRLQDNKMPPLAIKVVRVVFRWSNDRYMAPIDCPGALGETPAGLESMKDGLEFLIFWQLDVIMHHFYCTAWQNSRTIRHTDASLMPNKSTSVQ